MSAFAVLPLRKDILETFLNIKKKILSEDKIDYKEISAYVGAFRTRTFSLIDIEKYFLCIHVIEEIESLLELRKVIENGSKGISVYDKVDIQNHNAGCM
jgi:hypothetical protein